MKNPPRGRALLPYMTGSPPRVRWLPDSVSHLHKRSPDRRRLFIGSLRVPDAAALAVSADLEGLVKEGLVVERKELEGVLCYDLTDAGKAAAEETVTA